MSVKLVVKDKDILINSIYEHDSRYNKVSFDNVVLIPLRFIELFVKVFYRYFIKVFYRRVIIKDILVLLIVLLII